MSSGFLSEAALRVAREGLALVLLVSAPLLLASLVVGLVMGILQGATQIQDPTLAFIPKLVVVVLLLLSMGPLLGSQVLRFEQALLLAIPKIR